MPNGEQLAWGILSELNPEDVCYRVKATYDELPEAYVLKSFIHYVLVYPKDKKIISHSTIGNLLLTELKDYYQLSILWYLITAKDVPLSEKLVNPANLSGGRMYTKGSHALPLNRIAEKYGCDIPAFLDKGKQFGGEEWNYGDASLRFYPFPRVPVLILLWENDSEFSPRCSLLFDSTCEVHLPADIIWSTATIIARIML